MQAKMPNSGNGKKPFALHVPLRILVAAAFLAAISIVSGKYLQLPVGEVLRFSFENMPIILAGIAFGPFVGLCVGVVADLVGCLMVGYTINPLVTAGAACIGLVSGLVSFLLTKLNASHTLKIVLSVGIAHIVGSVLVKTVGLAIYYDMPLWALMLWRLLNYAIIGTLEGVILWFLLRSRAICHYVNLIKGKSAERQNKNENNEL